MGQVVAVLTVFTMEGWAQQEPAAGKLILARFFHDFR